MDQTLSISQESLIKSTHIFKGDQNSPLLAPRGVYLVQNKLLVADTGQNRLFIWNELPTQEFQEADIVLGQSSHSGTGRNQSGKVGADTLMYPSGLWSDGKILIAADAWNHRVLIWKEFPKENGQPADIVIGQPDFHSNDPNVTGISQAPSAQSLHWPYGVHSDGKQLWIADTGNRRVLYFKQLPEQNFQAADAVIGKANFMERDYSHENAIWPYSIKIGPKGEMAIADTQYYRILLWKDWRTAFDQAADRIIGQADFEQNGQNQFGWFPQANTLNWCYDCCFHQEGIFVADTGNSRVLWFEQIPTENNAPANHLFGQDHFQFGIENKNSIHASEGSLYWPFHLSIEHNTIAVADTGNHRIVLHQLK